MNKFSPFLYTVKVGLSPSKKVCFICFNGRPGGPLKMMRNAFHFMLKSDSPSKKNCSACFNNNSLKKMKNAFYFILKALFVLKVFKLLSWLFGNAEKTS